MISNRLTISPELSIRSFRDPPIQLKLARNHRLGEITFADEIRHHANFTNRLPDRTKTTRRASSVPLSKTRTPRFQKSSGGESPPRAPMSARSNPGSQSSHVRRSRGAVVIRIHAINKRPTPNLERPTLIRRQMLRLGFFIDFINAKCRQSVENLFELRALFRSEFLEARIAPERIEHGIEPEQRRSERHACSQSAFDTVSRAVSVKRRWRDRVLPSAPPPERGSRSA